MDLFHGEEEGAGVIWLRLYPLCDPGPTVNPDRPIIRLSDVDDSYWHTFFQTQFRLHWDELGEKLSENYQWQLDVGELREYLGPKLFKMLESPSAP